MKWYNHSNNYGWLPLLPDAGSACQHQPLLSKTARWPAETHNLFLEPPSLELPLRLGWHGATSPFLEGAPSSTTFQFVTGYSVTHHWRYTLYFCLFLALPQLSRGHLSLFKYYMRSSRVPLPRKVRRLLPNLARTGGQLLRVVRTKVVQMELWCLVWPVNLPGTSVNHHYPPVPIVEQRTMSGNWLYKC